MPAAVHCVVIYVLPGSGYRIVTNALSATINLKPVSLAAIGIKTPVLLLFETVPVMLRLL